MCSTCSNMVPTFSAYRTYQGQYNRHLHISSFPPPPGIYCDVQILYEYVTRCLDYTIPMTRRLFSGVLGNPGQVPATLFCAPVCTAERTRTTWSVIETPSKASSWRGRVAWSSK